MTDKNVSLGIPKDMEEKLGLLYFVGEGAVEEGGTSADAFSTIFREQVEAVRTVTGQMESHFVLAYEQIKEEMSLLASTGLVKMRLYKERPTKFNHRGLKKGHKRQSFLSNGKFHVYPAWLVPEAMRLHTLDYLMSDLPELHAMLLNILSSMAGQAESIATLRKEKPDSLPILYMEEELRGHLGNLNQMVNEYNRYAFLFHDMLLMEKVRYDQLVTEEGARAIDEAHDHKLLANYSLLLKLRGSINMFLEKEFIFLNQLSESLRKEFAQQTLAKLEVDMSARTQAIKEQRFTKMIENVDDFGASQEDRAKAADLFEKEFKEEAEEAVEESTDEATIEEGPAEGNSKLPTIIGALLIAAGLAYYFFLK